MPRALVPELVVAVPFLEVAHVPLRVGQVRRATRRGDETQPDEVGARQRAGVVHREIREERHAGVFDLLVADDAGLVRVLGHQRPQQELPVRREARRAMGADVRQVLRLVVEVGRGQHRAVVREPFGQLDAMRAMAVGRPRARIGPPEAVHRRFDLFESDVVRVDLDDRDHDVDVEEEVQVDVRDLEGPLALVTVAGPRAHAHLRDVRATEDADRRLLRMRLHRVGEQCGLALAVEEAAHVRQEGHELAVVTLLELRRVDVELVGDFAPRARVVAQRRPVGTQRCVLGERGELQRPDQDLAEVANVLDGVVGRLGHRMSFGARATLRQLVVAGNIDLAW